jgi:hypothetical protein
MRNLAHSLCKLPIRGNLLKLSWILAYVKWRRDEEGSVERQAIIWEIPEHEGRPESVCYHRCSSRTKRHSSRQIFGTLYGTGSCAAPCMWASSSAPGIAVFLQMTSW